MATEIDKADCDWFKVLQENFTHARHQENLRERGINLYLLAWGAALGLVYTKGFELQKVPVVFWGLGLMSFAILVSCLKWSAEYGNHIAAVALIAQKLELNTAVDVPKRRRILPFSEFRGLMALPLHAPLYRNVGVIMSLLQSCGCAIAFGLGFYGWLGSKLAGSAVAALVLTFCLLLCMRTRSWMESEISLRTGQPLTKH
jgi:hypothetical protein